MKLKFSNMLFVVGFFSILSQGVAMTCDYMDELRPLKRNSFLNKTLPTMSCAVAMNVASECQMDNEKLNLRIHEAALKACDADLEKSVKGKIRTPERAEAEIQTLKATRTQCLELNDLPRNQLFCQIEMTHEQIRRLNVQPEPGTRPTLKQGPKHK